MLDMDELMMLDMEALSMLLLLHKMWVAVSGNQFDKMKKLLDTMLCHLYVDILKKMVGEMMVKHLNSSSFSMIILNSTHLVIVLATEMDISMETDTEVEMTVQHCTIVMMKMVHEVVLVFDSLE